MIYNKLSELFADEKHWYKNDYVKNEKGEAVNIRSNEAFSYCLLGAIQYSKNLFKNNMFGQKSRYEVLTILKEEAAYRGHRRDVPALNDSLTHPELMQMLKENDL